MERFKIEGYELSFVLTDNKRNAFTDNIPYPYSVTIRCKRNKQIVTFPYASAGKITTRQDAAKAFYNMMQAALIGAYAPEEFCEIMRLDVHDPKTEDKFKSVREVTEKIYAVTEGEKISNIIAILKGGSFK